MSSDHDLMCLLTALSGVNRPSEPEGPNWIGATASGTGILLRSVSTVETLPGASSTLPTMRYLPLMSSHLLGGTELQDMRCFGQARSSLWAIAGDRDAELSGVRDGPRFMSFPVRASGRIQDVSPLMPLPSRTTPITSNNTAITVALFCVSQLRRLSSGPVILLRAVM